MNEYLTEDVKTKLCISSINVTMDEDVQVFDDTKYIDVSSHIHMLRMSLEHLVTSSALLYRSIVTIYRNAT